MIMLKISKMICIFSHFYKLAKFSNAIDADFRLGVNFTCNNSVPV